MVPMVWESMENFAVCALPVLLPRGKLLKEGNCSCRGMTGREVLLGAAQILLLRFDLGLTSLSS